MQRNGLIKKFDWPSRNAINQIRFDSASGIKHKLKVIEICKNYIMQNAPFLTRARLNSKNPKEQLIADIVNVEWKYITEVQDSESTKSLNRKRKIWEKYGFKMYTVKVD